MEKKISANANESEINLSDIQTITEHCLRLLSYTDKLRRNELTKDAHEYAEKLYPSLRKLFIASIRNLLYSMH